MNAHIIGRQVVNKQTEGKHNVYINIVNERKSTMENDRLNTNTPKYFYESELETKLKNASNDERIKVNSCI